MVLQVAPAVVILFLMFSGYFLNEDSVPVYMGWMKYISFIRWAFQVQIQSLQLTLTTHPGYPILCCTDTRLTRI